MSPVLVAAPAALLAAAALWMALRRKPSPEERERARRRLVNATGRMADGEVIDFDGQVLYYSYSVRGVGYSAAQDVSGISGHACDPGEMLGPVTVKYSARNPADSIVLCEEWSGINSRGGTFK